MRKNKSEARRAEARPTAAGRSGRPSGDASRQGGCRELKETSRKHGHSILHRCFLCIGAQPSSPHESLCHPSVLTVSMGRTALLEPAGSRAVLQTRSAAFSYCCPTRSQQVVQYATLPGRDGAGWPGGSDVEGSDTLHLRPAAVTDRTCRSLRPTAHRFACADVPRAAGERIIIHYRINVNQNVF